MTNNKKDNKNKTKSILTNVSGGNSNQKKESHQRDKRWDELFNSKD